MLVRTIQLYYLFYLHLIPQSPLLINRLLLARQVIPEPPVETSARPRKAFPIQSLPELGVILWETLRIQKLVAELVLHYQQRPEMEVHGSGACWREGFSWRRIDRSNVARQSSDLMASWALRIGYFDSAVVCLLAIFAADD